MMDTRLVSRRNKNSENFFPNIEYLRKTIYLIYSHVTVNIKYVLAQVNSSFKLSYASY